jgi:hypothetical protein
MFSLDIGTHYMDVWEQNVGAHNKQGIELYVIPEMAVDIHTYTIIVAAQGRMLAASEQSERGGGRGRNRPQNLIHQRRVSEQSYPPLGEAPSWRWRKNPTRFAQTNRW